MSDDKPRLHVLVEKNKQMQSVHPDLWRPLLAAVVSILAWSDPAEQIRLDDKSQFDQGYEQAQDTVRTFITNKLDIRTDDQVQADQVKESATRLREWLDQGQSEIEDQQVFGDDLARVLGWLKP